jgi:antitoxin HigA-1
MPKRDNQPIYPIHPSSVWADELAELKMSPTELARALHGHYRRAYRLVSGRRAMTAHTALRPQRRLGVSAVFWINLQKRCELDLATEKVCAEIELTVHRREPFGCAA